MATFRLLRPLAASLLLVAAACSKDKSNPVEPTPNPPIGLQVTATSSAAIKVTFQSAAGDNSYTIERAEGAAGTFAQVTSLPAPATAQLVTFDDTNLKVATAYRYRVAAVQGSKTSAFTSEQTTTTVAFGAFSKDVSTDITTSTTWNPETTYVLKGFIHVGNGATLTIRAGTTIKGDFNTLGASLFILRGAKINAVGTADAPIVFTSAQPVGQRKPGDWGGLIIVGNATTARTGVEIEIEGTNTVGGTTPGTNYKVTYDGGTVDTDNSGELRYVRVEFAGFAPSLNNELNSFTFATVGSGTKMSFLQAMAGLDDSYEWFGGTVDGDHLVSYESGDDHFDMSEGYRGRLQYLIAFQSTQLTPRTGAGGLAADPQGIENDGCPANSAGCTQGHNTTPFTTPIVANYTLIGTGNVASAGSAGGIGMMIRRGSGGWYVNGVVARWPRAAISLRDAETYLRAGSAATPDLATSDLAVRNNYFTDVATMFQATAGTNLQNSFDLAGNSLTQATTATAGLFAAFPATVTGTTNAASFDWTPAAGSPIATGGMATFTGKLATRAGTVAAGTAFVGAANPAGPKWWQGWTVYFTN
ncbi:MAG: fibronectin type III domain-containing protein [Gemmatimonadaceae bacterium]